MDWKTIGGLSGLAVVAGGAMWLGALNQRVGQLEKDVAELSQPGGKRDICIGLSSAWADAVRKGTASDQAEAINSQMERYGCASLAAAAGDSGEYAAATVDICDLSKDEQKLFKITPEELAKCENKTRD